MFKWMKPQVELRPARADQEGYCYSINYILHLDKYPLPIPILTLAEAKGLAENDPERYNLLDNVARFACPAELDRSNIYVPTWHWKNRKKILRKAKAEKQKTLDEITRSFF